MKLDEGCKNTMKNLDQTVKTVQTVLNAQVRNTQAALNTGIENTQAALDTGIKSTQRAVESGIKSTQTTLQPLSLLLSQSTCRQPKHSPFFPCSLLHFHIHRTSLLTPFKFTLSPLPSSSSSTTPPLPTPPRLLGSCQPPLSQDHLLPPPCPLPPSHKMATHQ